MYEPVELDYAKCHDLISAGIVGRIALNTPDGPQIVPVNYAVIDDAVVFRTTPYSVLGRYAGTSALAFETDNLDYERHRGWSVVATGRGELVQDETDLQAIRTFWDPRPWAGGNRMLYVRLPWKSLTGRSLGTWSRADETPVRRVL
jgi:uncharacterized protein